MATLIFNRVDGGPDLGRLNESERRVLFLLAEGHTAKTVARELGLTPAAVNERLREARRKTGVGSSRELARLLKSQQNRHEQMGMANRPAPIAGRAPTDAEPWRSQTGVIAMLSLFLVAVAGAAALMGQGKAPSGAVDPLLGEPLAKFEDPSALHAKVRSEPRDEAWAKRIEAAARPRLLQLPLVGKDGNELRITCAKTLCELAGSIVGTASEPYDPNQPINRAVADLQAKPLNDDLASLGLKSVAGTFTGGKKPDRVVFFLYYARQK